MTNLNAQIEAAREEMEAAGRQLDEERGESTATTFMEAISEKRQASELTERRYKQACARFDKLNEMARSERRSHEFKNDIDGAPC